MAKSKDPEIRLALHGKKLRAHRAAPNTIVVDELGLAHAKVRIDVAVINCCVHGYEIKSSEDTLSRLPVQLDLYTQCLEKLTLVCAPRHLAKAQTMLPDWCGIIEAQKGNRGGITFETIRRGTKNPNVDPIQLAHLLWRQEAVALLAKHVPEAKLSKLPRRELYKSLSELLSVPQLTAAIREFMQQRQTWRCPPAHA
jgi:hypothetical protein